MATSSGVTRPGMNVLALERVRSHLTLLHSVHNERAMLAYRARRHREQSDRAAPIRARGYRKKVFGC
jgi:hypothetical protein